MRIFLANVGVNTSDASRRGLKSPIFPDDTFEFIPIKESQDIAKYSKFPTYRTVKSWTGRAKNIAGFLPEHIQNYAVHNDPEFETFTYGDVFSPRASNLSKIVRGDQLWFLARLWDHDGKKWTGNSSFYLIGYFEVDQNIVIPSGTHAREIATNIIFRIKNNAHYQRLSIAKDLSRFRVIIGNKKGSHRFNKAIKVTPEVAGHFYGGSYHPNKDLYTRNGQVLRNKNGKPRRYGTFGSVTRSIQAHLDSNNREDRKYIKALSVLMEKCL